MKSTILWIVIAVCCSLHANAAEYRVGVVPQFEAQKIHRIWQPILEHLTIQTGENFKLVIEESIPAFERAFKRGDYDLAYMNPWHAVVAFDTQQYRPLIRDGNRQLKGILVVHRESGIENLEQLQGKEIAFPAPNALGASLLMRTELAKEYGIDIIPRYVNTHSSVYLNVALHSTLAGGGVMRTLKEQVPELQARLRILYETRPISPHPVVVHPRIPDELVAKLTQVFLGLNAPSEHNHLLSGIPMKKVVMASLDDYLLLREWGLEEFYVNE